MDVERSCRSKQVYLTKAHAKAISRLMSMRRREAIHIYACEHCRYWHVAHIEPAWIRVRVVANWEWPSVRLYSVI